MTNSNFTISVTKFNTIIKDIFNSEELLHNIKIVGEVFGISVSKTATYFSLKDEESTLPCVTFIASNMQEIKEGDMVSVTGSPNYYTKSGRFNFIVNNIEPFGLGLLYQRFLLLKEKLEKEGLFDETHKKQIPNTIKRIGVVSSKEGAVIQDIKNVSWRRNKAIDIVLYDVKVQGNDAEKEIAKGIEFFSDYDNVDVVVVARGGGSMEDLSAFNTELVARATYNCQKPIVSAVGHETDFTIIDFVSDLRAPTPSAAAELLTKDTKLSFETLRKQTSRISRAIDTFVSANNFYLQTLQDTFWAYSQVGLTERKTKFDKLVQNLSNKLSSFVTDVEHDLNLKTIKLSKLNPLDILALGYAKIEQNGKVLSSVKEVDKNLQLEINFADGTVTAVPKE